MQSRLRLHLAARIAFLAFLFLPPPVHAQAAPTFPKSWNDAVSQLADNVAAAWEKLTDKLGRENQIKYYRISMGLT